ncbi:hypothetical protein S40288_09915 [Stachybotrys chartarum IBT 40288]|nr:hypothetical protein S40288_09915 [Stachybotrys chartarum IBT 40288]
MTASQPRSKRQDGRRQRDAHQTGKEFPARHKAHMLTLYTEQPIARVPAAARVQDKGAVRAVPLAAIWRVLLHRLAPSTPCETAARSLILPTPYAQSQTSPPNRPPRPAMPAISTYPRPITRLPMPPGPSSALACLHFLSSSSSSSLLLSLSLLGTMSIAGAVPAVLPASPSRPSAACEIDYAGPDADTDADTDDGGNGQGSEAEDDVEEDSRDGAAAAAIRDRRPG